MHFPGTGEINLQILIVVIYKKKKIVKQYLLHIAKDTGDIKESGKCCLHFCIALMHKRTRHETGGQTNERIRCHGDAEIMLSDIMLWVWSSRIIL